MINIQACIYRDLNVGGMKVLLRLAEEVLISK